MLLHPLSIYLFSFIHTYMHNEHTHIDVYPMYMIYRVINLISVYGTLQLASLCQSVMDLATSNQTTSSPSAAISAVSSLAREHSQLREKLTTTSEQLEEVSFCQ